MFNFSSLFFLLLPYLPFHFIFISIPSFFVSLLLCVSLSCPSLFALPFRLSLIFPPFLPVFVLFIATFMNSSQSKYSSSESKTRYPIFNDDQISVWSTSWHNKNTTWCGDFILNSVCLSLAQTKECTEVNPQDVFRTFQPEFDNVWNTSVSRVLSYESPNTPTLSS